MTERTDAIVFSILATQTPPFPTKNGCRFMIGKESHVLFAVPRFGESCRQPGARFIVQIARKAEFDLTIWQNQFDACYADL
jgi:hypothetical protein